MTRIAKVPSSPVWILLLFTAAIAFDATTVEAWILSAATTTAAAAAASARKEEALTNNDKIKAIDIIPPQGQFRTTLPGEFSVVSYNALAPFYHTLQPRSDDNDAQQQQQQQALAAQEDRAARVALSLTSAKRCDADILCLQEVEQSGDGQNNTLRQLLAQDEIHRPNNNNNNNNVVKGYDEYLWAPLHPKRVDRDPVGLAVAWRSAKFRLVAHDTFRRGMVLALQDVKANKTVVRIANMHLPARPAAIEARLRFTAAALQRLRSMNVHGGPALFVGDMNCERKQAPNLRYLLEQGFVPHGTLRDRNYKMRLSKKAAKLLRHNWRFQHAYNEKIASEAAAVTVSLLGRGPGSMDHIYYTPTMSVVQETSSQTSSNNEGKVTSTTVKDGKRSSRRGRRSSFMPRTTVSTRVEAVLATVTESDPRRSQHIYNGLPNEEAGLFSDHLPIGALFVPGAAGTISKTKSTRHAVSPISNQAQQRRVAYRTSTLVRRRHNSVLRAIVEAFEDSCSSIWRDTALYKWPWPLHGVRQKMRAPDVLAVIQNQYVVVLEVTVVAKCKMDQAYQEKVRKYRDVMDALTEAVQNEGLSVPTRQAFVVALDEDGSLVDSSYEDLRQLVVSLCGRDQSELNSLIQAITAIVQEQRIPERG